MSLQYQGKALMEQETISPPLCRKVPRRRESTVINQPPLRGQKGGQ